MPQRLTKSSIYSRSLGLSACASLESKNEVCLLCEVSPKANPSLQIHLCFFGEQSQPLKILGKGEGLPTWLLYSWGGSRVDEMILARVSSGFAGEKCCPFHSHGSLNIAFNAESDLLESLLNRDSPIDSTKIDSTFDEFSLPRPPEESKSEYSDATIESLSPSPIPVEDSDPFMEEIDIFLASNDSTPPGFESDYDSEGDILLLEELLNDDLVPLAEYNHFTFDVEPDTSVKNDFDELNEDECFDPGGGENVVFLNVEEDDSFTFTIRTFLPFVTYPETDKSLLYLDAQDIPSPTQICILEGDNKLPVIIAKDLSVLEKTALIKVLQSHKRAIAWKLLRNQGKEGIVLGHKISKSGIEVDRAKIDVIAKLPYPTTVKGVRSFLGHAGFYRRFIQNFSKIARPMTHLLEKETPFYFSKECIEAFNTLKKNLTEAPILIAPDWNEPFELMCDASDFALGAVLGQRHEKHFRPIHYASKTMNEAESRYTTTEKEMLAVVYAFEKFRSYLVMNKCTVYTDHSALKYLFAKKDSKARLLRWVSALQGVSTFDVFRHEGLRT
ncbi:reverse transcriptase domain-containing protein [Tanacetum coccineum]